MTQVIEVTAIVGRDSYTQAGTELLLVKMQDTELAAWLSNHLAGGMPVLVTCIGYLPNKPNETEESKMLKREADGDLIQGSST